MYNLNRYPCGAFRTPKGYEFLSPYITMCGFFAFSGRLNVSFCLYR
nr:MAG TPA: hypothetical protein [Caudoviricetes sp.]